ncbi:MAG: glycosyltransferase family 2 protein [Gammaproteobacteria bacterium]|nr:glycosyltransferase family 2 protein [Gammaproteobacteria bacterium]
MKLAVLIPCYNEAAAIATTIKQFQRALPQAKIYVYDNHSNDDTAKIAKAAGAIVKHEPRRGKGYVVRRMFADIDADVYVMSDGDATYDPSAAPTLIEKLLNENLDMVIGARDDKHKTNNTFRFGHRFGNALFNKTVSILFGKHFNDILSGYRVFSKRFVKSFPALSCGFDTEAELTIHSLELAIPVAEVKTKFFARPKGSTSKLRSIRDGIRILLRILLMLKETKPLLFFGVIAAILAIFSLSCSVQLFITYAATGLVPKIPTAILVTGIMIIAFVSLVCGVILDSVARARRERKYLYYLSLPNFKNRTKEELALQTPDNNVMLNY